MFSLKSVIVDSGNLLVVGNGKDGCGVATQASVIPVFENKSISNSDLLTSVPSQSMLAKWLKQTGLLSCCS